MHIVISDGIGLGDKDGIGIAQIKEWVYVFIRKDIPINYQLVQVGHACLESGRVYRKLTDDVTNLVLLEVKDENELLKAKEYLTSKNIDNVMFHEPDFDNLGFTAIATKPVLQEERVIFKKYQLWKP